MDMVNIVRKKRKGAKKHISGRKFNPSAKSDIFVKMDRREKIFHGLERKRTTALSASFKKESVLFKEQKKKLNGLSKLISTHFKEIELNIKWLNAALKAKTSSKNTLTSVRNKIGMLQKELGTIEQTQNHLVKQEKGILLQLHNLTSAKKIKVFQPQSSLNQLKQIETTLLFLMDEADYLLKQGQEIKTSHLQIVEELASKEKGAISCLTKKLIDLKKERENVLGKKKMIKVEDSELKQKLKHLKQKQRLAK